MEWDKKFRKRPTKLSPTNSDKEVKSIKTNLDSQIEFATTGSGESRDPWVKTIEQPIKA